MASWKVSIAVAIILVVALFVLMPSVVLVIFAGVLVGALLHGGGNFIARPLHLATGYGIAILVLLVIAAFAAVGTSTASAIADQVDDLVAEIPAAFETLRARIEHYEWANDLIERANPSGLLSGEGRAAATTAVSTTFGALGNLVIIVFVGVYLALDPDVYRRGAIRLFAPSIRPRAADIMTRCAHTLKNWLVAQFMAMTIVGVLTGLGLWAIGMPLAIILGLIAGLLAFIPNIGPVLALLPALLLAMAEGGAMMLWVLAIYLSVQALESYVITPLIQQEKVHLPPALVISVQLLFGVMFGLMGLALAMPLTALAMTLTRELYIKDYLERSEPAAGARPDVPGEQAGVLPHG
ncbi:AI-2E family transporter [Pararhizobium haloflavum]|uniref:AI-2E family transporter n=1 Tax=Pararhizobium haloflavum TaxID=2037914 RepID=UPI000C1A5D6F|nr:AI-2E family transporter [Pararhizobium haloflavum]